MPRFFVENDIPSNDNIIIWGADAHHISHSLSMSVGQTLTVCDMARNEYECVIDSFSADKVSLKIVSVSQSKNEPPHFIRLFQAVPKGDKFETIIQKAVETGVGEIIPFYSEHCVARAKDSTADKKLVRRNKIALEAGKQCGRATIVNVTPPLDFKSAVSEAAKSSLPLFCYEGDGTFSLKKILHENFNKISDISIVIGSEGGFSLKEAEFAVQNGLLPVNLGRRILRCETASGFVLSALAYEFEL